MRMRRKKCKFGDSKRGIVVDVDQSPLNHVRNVPQLFPILYFNSLNTFKMFEIRSNKSHLLM